MNFKNIKDLENDIKDEASNIDVPEVYSSVKDKPIRKLKKGEKPNPFFSRKKGVILLAFLLTILIILSVCLLAIILTEKNTPSASTPTPEDCIKPISQYSQIVCSDNNIHSTNNYSAIDYMKVLSNINHL